MPISRAVQRGNCSTRQPRNRSMRAARVVLKYAYDPFSDTTAGESEWSDESGWWQSEIRHYGSIEIWKPKRFGLSEFVPRSRDTHSYHEKLTWVSARGHPSGMDDDLCKNTYFQDNRESPTFFEIFKKKFPWEYFFMNVRLSVAQKIKCHIIQM